MSFTNTSNWRAAPVAVLRCHSMNCARENRWIYADPLVFLAKSHQSPSMSPRSKKIGALLPAHSRSNPQSSEKTFRTSEFPPTGTPSFQLEPGMRVHTHIDQRSSSAWFEPL